MSCRNRPSRVAVESLLSVLIAISTSLPVACGADGDTHLALPEHVTFNAHIRPIMSNTCFACHGPDDKTNDSGFRIDSFESATQTIPSSEQKKGIVPGDASASEVFHRIMGTSDGEVMPPEEFLTRLSDYDKALFKKWIDQGAAYEQHWSYAPIPNVEPPSVESPDYAPYVEEIESPIDSFVLKKLEQADVTPTELADKATLLRRVSLDLIGLPPTLDQLDTYLNDPSPDAYEEAVERLLASEHYGERMASFWLDLVRFADTVGFHGDQNQRVFPYRDYVIEAFNSNKPFDEFTREQFAGDLLDKPTPEQLTATGFLRLNMVTREGGAQPGEYLAKYKADRVRTVGTAFLGSTLACCECHNHKYDPFSAKDFYSLGAFFDDIQQWGVYSDYRYSPNPDLRGFNNDYPFPPELRVRSESLLAEIAGLKAERNAAIANETNSSGSDTGVTQSEAFVGWLDESRKFTDQFDEGWQVLTLDQATASGESTATIQGDQSVLVTGPAQENEVLEISAHSTEGVWVNSIRLEVMPDETHDNKVGRGPDGRFTLDLNASVVAIRDGGSQTVKNQPRYVRIELTGKSKVLSLAEVEVFSKNATGKTINIALNGSASQSTNYTSGDPSLAIDGNTDGHYYNAQSTTHTAINGNDPWWEVDLGDTFPVEKISLWNRTDGDYLERLAGAQIVLLDDDRRQLYRIAADVPKPTVSLELPAEVELDRSRQLDIAWIEADLWSPKSYRNGQPPRYVQNVWTSGPARFQYPRTENESRHTAIYHLAKPFRLKTTEALRIAVSSGDVGRFRISVSPFGDATPGQSAVDHRLASALGSEADDWSDEETAAAIAAFELSTRSNDERSATANTYRDRIAERRAGYALTLIAQHVAPSDIPTSKVRPRGNWQDETGEAAPPAVPHFLPQPDATDRRLNRLDLANWITSPDNPLTARHFVNRTWKQFFGNGLSAKLDDLGNQGEWPSHPRLLDWLARDFIDSGWDMKHVVRQIVTSRTYRQAASVRPEIADIDPYNRLLAQQSGRRLEAEVIRDNTLAISGLLSEDYVGGPSVFPYQPDGHYSNLQFPNRTYAPTKDYRQYRRGVYMHWQRTFLHPMLVNFDAPSRDECTADRTLSNSPQQALTLLNDPSFVEASVAMADRLLTEFSIESDAEKLNTAFVLALSRDATEQESQALLGLLKTQLEYFEANPSDAAQFLAAGLPKASTMTRPAVHAAWGQVCRVILNLHETITRY